MTCTLVDRQIIIIITYGQIFIITHGQIISSPVSLSSK